MTYFHRSTDIVNRGSVVGIILLQMQILIDDKNVKSDFKKSGIQVWRTYRKVLSGDIWKGCDYSFSCKENRLKWC